MPTVFRPMENAEDGLPVIGASGAKLGARIGPHDNDDIAEDSQGNVHPRRKGMSVNSRISEIPFYRRPEELAYLNPLYKGSTNRKTKLYKLRDVDCVDCRINKDLLLTITKGTHGVVAPSRIMQSLEYQAALGATREQWEQTPPDGS